MVAFHEAGHGLLHYYLKNADPLHKITIIPHGRALGVAFSLPEDDAYSRNKGWLAGPDHHRHGRLRGGEAHAATRPPPARRTTSSRPRTSRAGWSASGA